MNRVFVRKLVCLWSISILVVVSGLAVWRAPSLQAACSIPEPEYGMATSTVEVDLTGTYRVWSRISNPEGLASSYLLEIDGGDCIAVGGIVNPADTWTWINYKDGNETSFIDIELTAGSHDIKMVGNSQGVTLDRLLFMPDDSCTPVGMGDSCLEASIGMEGDVNNDDSVNVFDLSVILTNWSRTDVIKLQGDLNGDGVVNVFDLSVVLTNWGKTK